MGDQQAGRRPSALVAVEVAGNRRRALKMDVVR
jgi:hypothetical protein